MAVAGFRLRNAFNHLVFMDELDVDNFRSLRGGDPRSAFPKNNSFCKREKEKKHKFPSIHFNFSFAHSFNWISM